MTLERRWMYSAGDYRVEYAVGKYHLLWFPMGPARPHLRPWFVVGSYKTLGYAIRTVWRRMEIDMRNPDFYPSLSEQEKKAIDYLRWYFKDFHSDA